MPTTIEITDEGWRRLNARKGPGDGFKDVVDDLLNEAETTDQPDLAVALDALQEAAEYAEDRGMDDVAQQLGELYQTVGREAPADDWDDVNDDHLMAVDHVVYKSLGGDEQAAEFREYPDRDDSLDVAGDDGPRRLDNPAWKDRMRTDDVQEETDDPEEDVWAVIDALDLPGSGEKLEGRQETIHDLYQHLQMEGTSRKSEFLKVLESSPHGYQSAESAWSNLIKGKDTLQSLPGVVAPGEGEHRWRYER